MKEYMILVPIHDNEGHGFGKGWTEWEDWLLGAFRGWTRWNGTVDGAWTDEWGCVVLDTSVVYVVAGEEGQEGRIAAEVKRLFRQEAVYVKLGWAEVL